MYRNIRISAGGGYDVRIGSGLLEKAGDMARQIFFGERVAIFTDSVVNELYGDRVETAFTEAGFETCRFVFTAGEQSKNIDTIAEFVDFMSDHSLTRKDAVVVLGGGVAGDMGGFAAAVYLRGIRFMQIPTTLLAAVDSSVGGKTGVDIANGKNLMGAFWQPSLVLYDTDTFKTLSRDLILDGSAEIIKTAAICDAELFSHIQTTFIEDDLEAIVEQCVKIKGIVVDEDEKETGLRKILNFGHTMGHAIEKYENYGISHGKAVAAGMVMVSRAAEAAGLSKTGTYEDILRVIKDRGYETELQAPLEELCVLAGSDKKRSGNSISLVYLKEIGKADIIEIGLEELYDFMK